MTPRVGMFVNYFSLVKGGAESYVADLSRHLERIGYRVTIVTGRSFFRKPSPARADAEIVYEPCLYELRELGRLLPGRADWLANLTSESFYNLFARRHLEEFDIVHSHGYDTARMALSSPGRARPVLLTMHGAPTGKPRVGRMLRRLDALVSPSEWIRDQVRRDHGVQALLIPMGVDLELFEPLDRAAARRQLGWGEGPIALFVGRLIDQKDVATLIRAFRRVAARRSRARLKIVGGGVLESSLRRLAASLGIGGRVDFIGHRTRQELRVHYSAADVTVIPSIHENFPMVALESMACGARLVVSDAVDAVRRRFPSVPSFPVRDHRRLASLLIDGFDGGFDPTPRESIDHHSWARIAQAYAGVYEDLLGRCAA